MGAAGDCSGCPAGRYGSTAGLQSANCSGPCMRGYWVRVSWVLSLSFAAMICHWSPLTHPSSLLLTSLAPSPVCCLPSVVHVRVGGPAKPSQPATVSTDACVCVGEGGEGGESWCEKAGVYLSSRCGAHSPPTPRAGNCQNGFYCEEGSWSPTGAGPCPAGFRCTVTLLCTFCLWAQQLCCLFSCGSRPQHLPALMLSLPPPHYTLVLVRPWWIRGEGSCVT